MELSMRIASFKSYRGLCKAELVALNRSSGELHSFVGIQNSNCFLFERSPSAFNRVFGTLQSSTCDTMQCGPNFYIAGIQGLGGN